jgi:hypothetical protein
MLLRASPSHILAKSIDRALACERNQCHLARLTRLEADGRAGAATLYLRQISLLDETRNYFK